MKKLLFIGLLIFTMALFAQYGAYVRFFDTTTNADFADISGISFEVELEPGSGDIQTGPSAGCFVNYTDVGAGFPNAFVQFDLGNFLNPYTNASNVRVTIWDGANVAGAGQAIYNVGADMDPAGGFMGWAEFFGVGGFALMVQPDDPIPGDNLNWGDGVTGNINAGTPGGFGDGFGTGLPFEGLLEYPENVGYYFILAYDDTLLGNPITITLDTAALGYVPYNIAFYYNARWYYVGTPMSTTAPAPWLPEVGGISEVTFTPQLWIDARGKGGRAPIDIPIVFADGPLPDDMLPVTLTNFLVNQAQNGQFATIAWTVQSESNMLHYNLYRSETDLESALKIVTINAENSSELYTYRHVDSYEIAYTTTYYYWLEGVEVNGHSAILANGEVTMEEPNVEVPVLSDVTKLDSNYPNPFNPTTKIKYFVKAGETATLQIFNAKGQLVQTATLGETTTNGGSYTFEGSKYGSGIYFYRLKTDNYSEVKKMMMLK